MSETVKICQKHGQLNILQIRKDGRCKHCRAESNKRTYLNNREERIRKAAEWRKKNREHYRMWAREDRKKYPEKYRIYAKTSKGREGVIRNIRQISAKFGLLVPEYLKMIEDQDNKCAICGLEETRKNRSGKMAALCIDHNHTTNAVRALLCHGCNQVIGHAMESIEILKSAIAYLEKHAE